MKEDKRTWLKVNSNKWVLFNIPYACIFFVQNIFIALSLHSEIVSSPDIPLL
jgi:hypothetical protein